MNEPISVPFKVKLSFRVGLGFVLQQIPFAITSSPPQSVTLPPQLAVFARILATGFVETCGTTLFANVVILISSP